jgi:hypothetical protein
MMLEGLGQTTTGTAVAAPAPSSNVGSILVSPVLALEFLGLIPSGTTLTPATAELVGGAIWIGVGFLVYKVFKLALEHSEVASAYRISGLHMVTARVIGLPYPSVLLFWADPVPIAVVKAAVPSLSQGGRRTVYRVPVHASSVSCKRSSEFNRFLSAAAKT